MQKCTPEPEVALPSSQRKLPEIHWGELNANSTFYATHSEVQGQPRKREHLFKEAPFWWASPQKDKPRAPSSRRQRTSAVQASVQSHWDPTCFLQQSPQHRPRAIINIRGNTRVPKPKTQGTVTPSTSKLCSLNPSLPLDMCAKPQQLRPPRAKGA